MKTYFFSNKKRLQYISFIGDLLLIAGSIFLAYALRLDLDGRSVSVSLVWDRINVLNVIFFMLHPFFMYVFGLYSPNQSINNPTYILKIVAAVFLSGLLAAAVLFFFPRFLIGRKVLVIHLPMLTVLLYLWRQSLFRYYHKRNKFKKTGLALVGRGDLISSLIEEIKNDPYSEYEVKAVCLMEQNKTTCFSPEMQTIQIYSDIKGLIDRNRVEALAIDNGLPLDHNEIQKIVTSRFVEKRAIYDLTKVYENVTGKVPISFIDGRWFFSNPLFQGSPSSGFIKIKRLFDLCLSICLLIITAPVLLLVALLVKMESRGPALFMQERLGENKIPFVCLKFRTMVENAEIQSGPVWSSDNDQRITRMGRFLRKSRLDELPQLFNVLKGDMSFVGPRPIREHFANQLAKSIPFYWLRFNVKPGLSGWAQVKHDYAGSEKGQLEKYQYELFYIQHMSFMLDLHIIFGTIKTVFKFEGK